MSGLGNKEIFGKNLSHYVERSGRDQREIADVIGVAPSTFNEWVKGRKYPRIDKIQMLSEYFGIKMSDLIEDSSSTGHAPSGPALTEVEQKMLELFRQIPVERRESALEVLEAVLKMQKTL